MRIIESIKQGNKIVAYVVDCGSTTASIAKDDVIKLIKEKKIENAAIQMWQGKPIIRIKDKLASDNKQNKSLNNIKKLPTGCGDRSTSVNTGKTSITDKAEGVIKNSSDFKTTELSGDSAIEILKRADKGLPLKIKIGKYGNWKQVIFMGMIDDSKFRFFDGHGVTGQFDFSFKYIANNPDKLQFKFNDNDTEEITSLLNYIRMPKQKL